MGITPPLRVYNVLKTKSIWGKRGRFGGFWNLLALEKWCTGAYWSTRYSKKMKNATIAYYYK